MSTTSFDYALVDVFAEHPLEGNQLAIFTDARGLSDQQMQALARETNLAETTFILPSGDPANEREQGVRVRIFTVQEELPFAGHPTLGTSSWLFWNRPDVIRTVNGIPTVTLALNAGPITVQFETPDPARPGLFGTMAQLDPVFGPVHLPEEVARVLNLSLDDLDLTSPIQTVSTGLPFVILPFRTLEAIQRLEIPQAAARRWLDQVGAKFFFCVAPAHPDSGAQFHNRLQFYAGEDPATGSASGCAIAWLVRHQRVASGQPIIFEQGIEILRPSRIHVRASLADNKVSDVFVGGRTIPVAMGRFFLP